VERRETRLAGHPPGAAGRVAPPVLRALAELALLETSAQAGTRVSLVRPGTLGPPGTADPPGTGVLQELPARQPRAAAGATAV